MVCIVCFFGSALIGGFVFKSGGKVGFAVALWIAAGIKVLICVAWCLWKRKVVPEMEGMDVQQV